MAEQPIEPLKLIPLFAFGAVLYGFGTCHDNAVRRTGLRRGSATVTEQPF
ncbi:hypothetical protein ACFQ3B_15160 [Stackebrandtia endophytica]|nr:hypothetical protein [Stackebrandtia endophytica]